MRPLSRLLTAVFALWFAVVLGDPGVLHACPMHGAGHGGHGSHGATTMGAGHAAGAAGAAGAAHDMAAMDMSQDAPPSHDAAVLCTCVGHCSAASSVASLPLAPATYVPAEVRAEHDPLAAPSLDVPAAPDLRLPFANGPPTA